MKKMIIPFPPRIFVTLSFILGLAACHCVRGPTARGVGVGPLGFGATAEAGAVIGLRVFKPDIGNHGEVYEVDTHHAAVVLDLSVPGTITLAKMIDTYRLGQFWPLHRDMGDDPMEFLPYPDRVTFVQHPVFVSGAAESTSTVVLRDEGHVLARGDVLTGTGFDTPLVLFPPGQVKPGSTPRLAVSPGGRFVAGVFVGYGLIATFLVEFSPGPRIRRPPTWIQLGTEPLTGVVTAVSDDGQQMIRATGSVVSPTTNFFVTLSPDGTRTDLTPPADPIEQILAVPGGWLLQTPAAILHLDSEGVELARSTTQPQLAEALTTRRMLLFAGRLFWFELTTITTRKAQEGFCDEGTPAIRAVKVCATWFTARFDVTGQSCTTFTEAQVQALTLPTIPLSSL
ncbi:hypothetical protein KKD52_03720 [Myxococcota bacterium]|nr:hypothetical protein [Myxococcota bacterium]